jgi:hypothetical protein
MKNPSNYPTKCLSLIKKITSCTFIIAGALIVIFYLDPDPDCKKILDPDP